MMILSNREIERTFGRRIRHDYIPNNAWVSECLRFLPCPLVYARVFYMQVSFTRFLWITQKSLRKIVFSKILQCLFLKRSVIGMRLHRFFIAQPLGEEIVIHNKDLMKQWFLVFRYTIGDSVVLFNGDGND